MFTPRFWAPRFWSGRYWPPGEVTTGPVALSATLTGQGAVSGALLGGSQPSGAPGGHLGGYVIPIPQGPLHRFVPISATLEGSGSLAAVGASIDWSAVHEFNNEVLLLTEV